MEVRTSNKKLFKDRVNEIKWITPIDNTKMPTYPSTSKKHSITKGGLKG